MLVLTRKLNEEIMIGDDIKVTLIRVRGNTVRIGIEAPRDVRIVRGELDALADDASCENELSDREQAFAHPNDSHVRRPAENAAMKPQRDSASDSTKRVPLKKAGANRLPMKPAQLFVGTVKASGDAPKLARAPLADFVAAS